MVEMLTVAVRQMEPADAVAVADLTTQLGYAATEAEIRRRFDLIKDRSDAAVLVAQDAGASVVGWIHVQALCSLEADTRGEGLTVMALRSNALRIGAQGFYEHLGYRVTKTQNAFRKNLT